MLIYATVLRKGTNTTEGNQSLYRGLNTQQLKGADSCNTKQHYTTHKVHENVVSVMIS